MMAFNETIEHDITDNAMNKKEGTYLHTINYDWCKACGICVHFCPRQVYEADRYGRPVVKHRQKCIGCRLCQYRCPDLAVEVVPQQEAS